jgi:hypothetical protein
MVFTMSVARYCFFVRLNVYLKYIHFTAPKPLSSNEAPTKLHYKPYIHITHVSLPQNILWSQYNLLTATDISYKKR